MLEVCLATLPDLGLEALEYQQGGRYHRNTVLMDSVVAHLDNFNI